MCLCLCVCVLPAGVCGVVLIWNSRVLYISGILGVLFWNTVVLYCGVVLFENSIRSFILVNAKGLSCLPSTKIDG